jgi:hypothetical protein
MKYVVDAKIEKGQPCLRILDAETGKVYLEWSLTRINRMFEEGEIPPDDFLHPERYGMNLLLKNLFLLSCIESFSKKNHKLCINKTIQDSQHNDSEWHFGIKIGPSY